MPKSDFPGFPPATMKHLRALAQNNNRAWFDENRVGFEAGVMDPAKAFVVALGERLGKLAPDLVAEPRTDRSIFRLHRDVRFSADKSPYKTHVGILLWDAAAPKMESAGFYLHLEPGGSFVGMGMHIFAKRVLPVYREAVADAKRGPQLVKILDRLEKAGYRIGGEHYKRVPRGMDPGHPREKLLRHAGLHVQWPLEPAKILESPELLDFCHSRFKEYQPLHGWLVSLLAEA